MPSTNYTLTGVSEARGRMEGGFCRGKRGAYGEMGALKLSSECVELVVCTWHRSLWGGDRQ